MSIRIKNNVIRGHFWNRKMAAPLANFLRPKKLYRQIWTETLSANFCVMEG